MPIVPLPQFEADAHLSPEDQAAYAKLKAPKTVVVRYGAMKLIGEFPYDGDAKPGCGSKLVVRTHRGTEVGEMLTSTCPNSSCSKSVSRQEMLQYIENSGGKDYPFTDDGRVLRIATGQDLERQAALEQSKHELKMRARAVAEQYQFPMKIVEAEPILGGERLTLYYLSEDRIDFRDLVRDLATEFRTRIELRQVGARDEARLIADYERCGQYCCCKNFLKVLKPISMKSAKMQKATLDPLKISGRCGRLMCCLRYEDQTYEDLVKRLPKKKARVGTAEGDGTVLDGQILTQLVLVRLDELNPDGSPKDIAVTVEELQPPKSATPPPAPVYAPPPTRRPEARGPEARSPEARSPEARPPEPRGPQQRRPDQRGPDQRGPEQRGPEQRGPRPPRPDGDPGGDRGGDRGQGQRPPRPQGNPPRDPRDRPQSRPQGRPPGSPDNNPRPRDQPQQPRGPRQSGDRPPRDPQQREHPPRDLPPPPGPGPDQQ
jgi:cell fate regulator YaaT (PSP1 superfamily)